MNFLVIKASILIYIFTDDQKSFFLAKIPVLTVACHYFFPSFHSIVMNMQHTGSLVGTTVD
jgi:hypothetical protein